MSLCVHVYVCLYVCMFVCVRVCVCVPVYACACMCVQHVCTYTLYVITSYIIASQCVGSSGSTSSSITHVTVTQFPHHVTTLIILNSHKLHIKKWLHIQDKTFRHKRTKITANRFVAFDFKISTSHCFMFRC